MDPDHLDIYGTGKTTSTGFRDFAGRVKEGGLLIKSSVSTANMKATHTLTYSLQNDSADYMLTIYNLKTEAMILM